MFYDDDNVVTLIIREVFPEDAGTFTCVAKNSAGFASTTAQLEVETPLSYHGSDVTGVSRKSMSRESSLADILEGIPPTFSRKPKAKCVDEGTDVVLQCRLVAVPEPDVTWYCDRNEVTTKDNVKLTHDFDMHTYSSIVKITKVKKTQEGLYSIVARNREGEARVEFVLKVMKKEDKVPPTILEPLKSEVVKEDDTVQLSAQIIGRPVPKITWLKDGKPLRKAPAKADENTYTLTLHKTKPEDTGEYSVTAENEHGTAMTMALLTVEGKNFICIVKLANIYLQFFKVAICLFLQK